jgi:hypothetical protein
VLSIVYGPTKVVPLYKTSQAGATQKRRRTHVSLSVLTRAKSPVIGGRNVLAGLKTRFPGLKSGAGTIPSFPQRVKLSSVDARCGTAARLAERSRFLKGRACSPYRSISEIPELPRCVSGSAKLSEKRMHFVREKSDKPPRAGVFMQEKD